MTDYGRIAEQDALVLTFADLIAQVEKMDLPGVRRRDMVSALKRFCFLCGSSPSQLVVEVSTLRETIARILPARHRMARKTFANVLSLVREVLEKAGAVDRMQRGLAHHDPEWGPLVISTKPDRDLALGLASLMNWCARRSIKPCDVDDAVVRTYLSWLETRTLARKPKNMARRAVQLWNRARKSIPTWPDIELTPLSFRPKSDKLRWEDLSISFRRDAETHLSMRAKPDIFDDRPNIPVRPLAASTLRQQREHLRLAASVLVKSGVPVSEINSLAILVAPEALKIVLRHYHERAKGKPNAFAITLAKTLIAVARYHVSVSADQVIELRRIAGKLPSVSYDLTEKNKALLRHFESEHNRAALLYLPERLLSEAKADLDGPRLPFVKAQVGIAVDILTVAPLRPQNLIRLNWRRHISEPNGPRGPLRLHIPAAETKTKKRELIFEIPGEVAARLRWYRRVILPQLGADPEGNLFITRCGTPKNQETLTQQITEGLETHVGLHMTPHQFRHMAAWLYLEHHPEDFETVRSLLGHSFAKTTLMYIGASGPRASRAYGAFLQEQREELRLKRPRRRQPARRT